MSSGDPVPIVDDPGDDWRAALHSAGVAATTLAGGALAWWLLWLALSTTDVPRARVVLMIGVPISWLAALVVVGVRSRDTAAGLGAYLAPSGALLVVGAFRFAESLEGVDIDSGGGAAMLAIPAVLVGGLEVAAGLALLAVSVLQLLWRAARPTPEPSPGPPPRP